MERMTAELIEHKHSFRVALGPMIDLFEYKKTLLDPDQWLKFINATKSRIILNPEQFLGKSLPSELLIQQIVEEIFADYLEQEVIEA